MAFQATALLADMLRNADDLHLEWSIADALRLSWDVSATQPLLALASSPSASVRRTVAMGLAGAMSDTVAAPGLETLIRLSADPDPTVRDWATFGLAFGAWTERSLRRQHARLGHAVPVG